MSQTDLLSDALTRIRNAQTSNHAYTYVLKSNFVKNVLEVLKDEGYIKDVDAEENKIKVELKYNDDGVPVISEIVRVSKPGRRVYKAIDGVDRMYGGLGIVIMSTSKGIMTDEKARQSNVGGEILCKIF